MKPKDTPKQYVIYSRKSKFTGKGESIENQIELCRQYIAMHFGEDAAENVLVYEDEGFSGGNLERPQFKKMMKDSQKIAFAAIVVYRLDRISRNIGDFAKLIEDLGDRHIDFISIREQFDTSSPMGRAMMYIASVFSQLERETIAERIRDNMYELSKTGRWLGGTTPTGYASESLSSVTVDGKVKKACKLKPIPEEIQLVKTIFEVFMETGSLNKTDQYLWEHRCVTKRGKQFTRFAIRGILTNPVYMIADETAYQYLKENNVDLFAETLGVRWRARHHGVQPLAPAPRQGKPDPSHGGMDHGGGQASRHHRGQRLGAGAGHAGCQQIQELPQTPQQRGAAVRASALRRMRRLYAPEADQPQECGRRADLHLHVLHQGAQPRYGLLYENCNGNTLDAKIIEEIRKLSADKETLPGCWRRPRRLSAAARRATMQSLRCSGRNTPRRKNASSGWWSPCPLPATPPRSTSWSRSTRSIRRARHSSCALPSWKPSPNRAGCCIRSSPSIRK